jgi:hypothetical protein
LVFTNVQTIDQGLYSVVVSNTLGVMTSGVAMLTVELGDCDQDGLPDAWELEHGLSPSDANDRDLDSDHDGMTNWQEYLAGTDPDDAASVMRITGVMMLGDELHIIFTGCPGKQYRLERLDRLSGQWTGRQEFQITDVPEVELVEPREPADSGQFYRIRLLP